MTITYKENLGSSQSLTHKSRNKGAEMETEGEKYEC